MTVLDSPLLTLQLQVTRKREVVVAGRVNDRVDLARSCLASGLEQDNATMIVDLGHE